MGGYAGVHLVIQRVTYVHRVNGMLEGWGTDGVCEMDERQFQNNFWELDKSTGTYV